MITDFFRSRGAPDSTAERLTVRQLKALATGTIDDRKTLRAYLVSNEECIRAVTKVWKMKYKELPTSFLGENTQGDLLQESIDGFIKSMRNDVQIKESFEKYFAQIAWNKLFDMKKRYYKNEPSELWAMFNITKSSNLSETQLTALNLIILRVRYKLRGHSCLPCFLASLGIISTEELANRLNIHDRRKLTYKKNRCKNKWMKIINTDQESQAAKKDLSHE